MQLHQILAMIAGFNPWLVLPPTDATHPYRLVIPGLNVDIPYYWHEHEERLGKEES